MRILFTALLMSIFFWSWPVRLIIKQNNCYFWTLERLITQGGSVKWYASKTWNGYHCTWIDNDAIEWEYTMPRMGKKPWWYVPLFYNGKIRKVKNGKTSQGI